MYLESGCLSLKVPYAFIQPNGSWCWSNAGFIASVEGPGLLGGRFPWGDGKLRILRRWKKTVVGNMKKSESSE